MVLDNFAESLSLITLTLVTVFLITETAPVSANTAGGLSALCLVVALLFLIRIGTARYERVIKRYTDAQNAKSSGRQRSAGATENINDAYAGGGAGPGSPRSLTHQSSDVGGSQLHSLHSRAPGEEDGADSTSPRGGAGPLGRAASIELQALPPVQVQTEQPTPPPPASVEVAPSGTAAEPAAPAPVQSSASGSTTPTTKC